MKCVDRPEYNVLKWDGTNKKDFDALIKDKVTCKNKMLFILERNNSEYEYNNYKTRFTIPLNWYLVYIVEEDRDYIKNLMSKKYEKFSGIYTPEYNIYIKEIVSDENFNSKYIVLEK